MCLPTCRCLSFSTGLAIARMSSSTLLNFPQGSKEVLNDVIEQFASYFKPSQSTFQSWYELGFLDSSQFKNQNDFLNKLLDVPKDCELDNPNELVKFLFHVHNQKNCVHENLLKEMKSDSTLHDCLHIAKLTKGTVHVEKLGQNFLTNVEKHDQNVDAVNRGRQQFKKQNESKFRPQSRSQSQGGPKGNQEGKGGKKSCGNCGTNHPPHKCPAYGKDCFRCKKKGHFSAYYRSSRNNQQHGHTPSRGHRHQHEVEQDDNGDNWTFSLNQDEVVIKFTDSVTKLKGSKNVMFNEIELSRVLVDLKVQAALTPNENCTPVPNNCCPLHKLRYKLDSGAHGNLMPISMYKSLFPGLPHDLLRKSIDKRVTLVAYNKQEIKQLCHCCINVSKPSTGRNKTCKFFAVGDHCNPIIGLHDSIALNLLSVNVPLLTDGLTNLVLSGQTTYRC